MKPPHPSITVAAFVISAIASSVASPMMYAPMHTLFGHAADQIKAAATILAVVAAAVASIGKSPLPSEAANNAPANPTLSEHCFGRGI